MGKLPLFATALVATAALLPQVAQAEVTLVRAGRVIVDANKPALGPSTIAVRDGRIVKVASGNPDVRALVPDLKPDEPVKEIDLSSKTVLPGLIDAHVHLSGDPGTPWWKEAVNSDEYATAVGTKNALVTVRAGFTTVRDLGSGKNVGFALRDAVRDGVIVGPRILSSGPAISIIGGHGDVSGFRREVVEALSAGNTCTGAVQCAARVREASRAGADVIKITATGGVLSQQARGLGQHFTNEELEAIMDTAHSLGLKVAAHAHGAKGIETAARAGVDSIEHGTFVDDAGLKVMKEKGTYMVPTLMAFTGISERLGKGVYTPQVEEKIRQTLKVRGKQIAAAKHEGVPIAFGTDSAVYEHGRNGEEFGLMVQYGGLTPREALASATTSAAKLLGLESEIGTLEPGKSADIIAVDGDPLTNVRVLEKVQFVMASGRVVPMQ
ncbi:metal-dependent hydrolase family protein [Pedomonas mirosovicensis]|uniref:metal-dependent hydrolase family protein n=1 Tax=Pedomonas mirosovicensis TaxID=2908641 RepID=UPI002166FAFD|nr:amidohydrolase family protein [Pedomonas mirosovicensis]MCH8683962.1 amidohydrolase family protein [Pedomonas mirosovicensis]